MRNCDAPSGRVDLTLSYGAVNASSGDAVKSITERHNVLKKRIRSMKTFLGFEVSYAPCKCKITSDIRVHLVVLVKWCPLADSVIVAP